MLDLKVTGITWGIFVSATMKAAVHLGPDYEKNLFIRAALDIVRYYAKMDPESRK